MKTVAAVLKEARKEGQRLAEQRVVVMDRGDFNYLLEYTARTAFEAGQAAGLAKSKSGRKRAVNVPDEDDFDSHLEDAWSPLASMTSATRSPESV